MEARRLGGVLRSLEADPASDPEQTAAVRHLYGKALLELGPSDEAVRELARAASDFGRLVGPESPATFVMRVKLIAALLDAARFAEAAAAASELKETYEGRTGAEHVACHFAAGRMIAAALSRWGRHADALAEIEAMLPAADAEGVRPAQRVAHRGDRLDQLILLGRADEALDDAREILATATEAADDDPDGAKHFAGAAQRVAFALTELGRPAEAERQLRAALAHTTLSRVSVYDPRILHVRLDLVVTLNGQGRHAEALAAFEALPGTERTSLTDPAYRIGWFLFRAVALHGLARRAEAETAAEQALAEAASRIGPHHFGMLEIRTLLASIRASAEEMAVAAAQWEEHFGPAHPRARAARTAAGAASAAGNGDP
ncbi:MULTISPECIES: hypothetical protein [unclassified Streptomyces]|uniref:hypothetical protein n=1 Tax=unclassified Streptomyces TaxID=2593676 RepID=UPI00114CCB1E|nr:MULTISPECIES: hypothetical protein [unclassified Streptomyces]MYS23417.1 hypothetical protein [Streptomyces sp. SID4948]